VDLVQTVGKLEEQLRILSDPNHMDALISKCQLAQRELDQWTVKRRELPSAASPAGMDTKVH
jgi:hypothetical protein